jgi:localization factor PodJL
MYEKGVGVPRDAAKARELYKKAADAGNARAMHNLAVLFAQDGGEGKPDYAGAIEWFRKAGAYGVRDSQFNLGVLYGRGLGAAQDLSESWMWFSLAARQGDPDAAKKRDEVENRMDGRAMAAAKKLLDGFKIKPLIPAANDAPPAPAAAATSAPPADAKAAGVKG